MIFIVVLALLIFGPKRLPEVGRTIGKGMAQFRKATSDLKRTIESEIALESEPARPPGRPTGAQPRHPPQPRPAASLTAPSEPSDVSPGDADAAAASAGTAPPPDESRAS